MRIKLLFKNLSVVGLILSILSVSNLVYAGAGKDNTIPGGSYARYINLWQVACEAWTICENKRVINCIVLDSEVCTSNYIPGKSVICTAGVWGVNGVQTNTCVSNGYRNHPDAD